MAHNYQVTVLSGNQDDYVDIDGVLVDEHVLKLMRNGEIMALYAPGAWRSIVRISNGSANLKEE